MRNGDRQNVRNTTHSRDSSNESHESPDPHDVGALIDLCADFVSQEAHERFVVSLLSGSSKGQWLVVEDICRKCGLTVPGVTPDLYVTWLDDPQGDLGYVLIVFVDDSTKLSAVAQYNRDRLRIGAP